MPGFQVSAALLLLGLLSLTNAQTQVVWGQCGGIGWSGPTSCTSGTHCATQNPYYSQCIPGGSGPTSPTVTTAMTSTSQASPGATLTGNKYMFIFGDSYTATNSFSGYNTYGNHPSAQNPIGNPALPGSTFSGGLNWVGDLLTQLNTSVTLGYNFAVGGATVDNSIVQGTSASTPDFVAQQSLWQGSLANKPTYAPWTSANTIAGAFFGINDILGEFWKGATPPTNALMARYFAEFQSLYNAGVRNFFVLNVPPLARTPLIMGQSSAGQTTVTNNIQTWNSELTSNMAAFKAKNPEVNVAVVVDTWAPFNAALSNPNAYGSHDATCYNSNGVSCLWWDTLHPGQAIQKLISQAVAAGLKGNFF